jgi:hypothetical protein
VEDWLADIELASANDMWVFARTTKLLVGSTLNNECRDGFALNVGKEDWVKDRVTNCFEAMSRTTVPFKFFISFDMRCISLIFKTSPV